MTQIATNTPDTEKAKDTKSEAKKTTGRKKVPGGSRRRVIVLRYMPRSFDYPLHTCATAGYLAMVFGHRTPVWFRKTGWTPEGDDDMKGLEPTVVGIASATGNIDDRAREHGREVGPLPEVVKTFGSSYQKAIGERLVYLVTRFGGKDVDRPSLEHLAKLKSAETPASKRLTDEDIAFVLAWFNVKEGFTGQDRIRQVMVLLKTWMKPQVEKAKAEARVKRMMASEASKPIASKGAVSFKPTSDAERQYAFAKRGGAGLRFIVEANRDGTIQAIVVAAGAKAGIINGSFQILAGRKDESEMWQLSPKDGHVVFYRRKGVETAITVEEFCAEVMQNF